MKTIVVSTDFSTQANNALHYAAQLARELKATLKLFNVVHLSFHTLNNRLTSPESIDHIMADKDNQLRELAVKTAEEYQIEVGWVYKKSASTETVEVLKEYAASHPVDLVVMGMQTNLTEYKIFGNTTTAAIRRLNMPILVVPNDCSFSGIGKILFACEYSYLKENNHLDLLREIALKFEAQLQIYHVDTRSKAGEPVTTDAQVEAMDAIMEDVDHTYLTQPHSSIGEGILQGVAAYQPDMLVMVPHHAGLFESFIKGSKTREMVLITKIPLLVLPNLE